MTANRWISAGFGALVVAAVLAILAALDAFDAVHHAGVPEFPGSSAFIDATVLIRAFVFAALAGAAFFTALACFFWSSTVEARRQRGELLELLTNQSRTSS